MVQLFYINLCISSEVLFTIFSRLFLLFSKKYISVAAWPGILPVSGIPHSHEPTQEGDEPEKDATLMGDFVGPNNDCVPLFWPWV